MQYFFYALGFLVAAFLIVAQVGIVFIWWVHWQIIKAIAHEAVKPQSPSDPLAEITVALVPRYCKGRIVKGQWSGIYIRQAGICKYCSFEGGALETEEQNLPLAASILRRLKLRYFSARGEDAGRTELVNRPPLD